MNIEELVKLQVEFDKTHGFKLSFESTNEKFLIISKEIVGLVGEIGEFANIVKKINLSLDSNKKISNLSQLESNLSEELIDTLIYLIRLSVLLDIDIPSEYLNKKQKNSIKYQDRVND
jgi:NTP pyrophosphatase (non-canonical NTP hydrolase)